MVETCTIELLVDDPSVLAALRFALMAEGFVIGGCASQAVVIDERYRGDGLQYLEEMRASGNGALAIVIATHPSPRLRTRIANCNAILVEKPLMGDEISQALGAVRAPSKAA